MAIFYIDPTRAANGDGSEGSPFNSWSSVSWAPGNSYLQKADTDLPEQISVGTSGTAAAPIIIGKYGTGKNPRVGLGSQYGIYIDAKQYIKVVNLDVENCTSYGVYVRGTGAATRTNLEFWGVSSTNNARTGFYCDSIVLDGILQNIIFAFCDGSNNGEHGFDNLGIVKNVFHYYCTANKNGANILGHGFSIHPFSSTSVTSGWDQSGGEAGNVYGRTLSASEDVQKVLNRTDRVTLTKNPGAGTGVTLNQWDQTGTRLRINIGANPNTKTMAFKRAPHGPFYYYYCTATFNSTNAGPGEGHGFASDDMTGPSEYLGCLSQFNEGAGIQCQWTDDVAIIGCVTDSNNLSGIRTTGFTDRLKIYNNTSVNSNQYGIFVESPFTSVEIINNIAAFNGKSSNAYYGIAASVAGTTASNNGTFGNGLSGTQHTNNVTNTNGITSDPQLNTNYIPQNSAYSSVGTYLAVADFYGKAQKNPPDVGAIQSFSSKGTQTRTPTTRTLRTNAFIVSRRGTR